MIKSIIFTLILALLNPIQSFGSDVVSCQKTLDACEDALSSCDSLVNGYVRLVNEKDNKIDLLETELNTKPTVHWSVYVLGGVLLGVVAGGL